jgi:subtilase family serine protease
MALQGQSMFVASGDTGAFGCIRSTSGTTVINVDDPAEPWVTTVGGTSFESFNPLNDPDPHYPAGVETVWNVDNLLQHQLERRRLPRFLLGAPQQAQVPAGTASSGAARSSSSVQT